jgi:hypothetical protein
MTNAERLRGLLNATIEGGGILSHEKLVVWGMKSGLMTTGELIEGLDSGDVLAFTRRRIESIAHELEVQE